MAYDKGIRILAASQTDDVALELEQIRQGLLTYAVVHDGLERGRAGKQDATGEITADGWLRYVVDRVSKLFEDFRTSQDPGILRNPGPFASMSICLPERVPRRGRKRSRNRILFNFRRRRGSGSAATLA